MSCSELLFFVIFQVNLYVGLAVMCGFIVFDTQVIIEKAREGDKDYIMHSLDLFIDFIAVFKRLLIILTDKVNVQYISVHGIQVFE